MRNVKTAQIRKYDRVIKRNKDQPKCLRKITQVLSQHHLVILSDYITLHYTHAYVYSTAAVSLHYEMPISLALTQIILK